MECTITFTDGDEPGSVNMVTDFGDAETETGSIKMTPATLATIGAAALFRTDAFSAAGAIVTTLGGKDGMADFNAGEFLDDLLRNGDICEFAFELMTKRMEEAVEADHDEADRMAADRDADQSAGEVS